MLLPPRQWETPRLRLRPPTRQDAEAILQAYAQDAEVTRDLPWRPHRSVQDTHVDNPASARVLERLGLQHEGILRRRIQHPKVGSVPRDAHCYAVVR